jgi:hypothetical protein
VSTYTDFTTDASAISKGAVVVDTANPINQITFEVGSFTHTMDSTGNLTVDGYTLSADGLASLPSFAFSSETNSGVYKASSGVLGFSTLGTQRMNLSSSGLNLNSNKITGLGTPTATTDAATKSYVDTAVSLAATTFPLYGPDGSVSTPTYSFASSTGTGMYSDALGEVLFSSSGVLRLTLSSTAATFTGSIHAPNGSFSAPGLSFSSDATSGLWMSGPILGVSTSGVSRLLITSSAISAVIPISLSAGSAAACAVQMNGTPGTGLYSVSSNVLGVSASGALQLSISSTAATFTNQIVAPTGSATTPSYSFNGDTNTGMYHTASAETIGFCSNGSSKATIDALGLHIATGNTLYVADGTASSPAIRFEQDVTNNAGFYRSGTGAVNFVSGSGGVDRIKFDATGLTVLGASSGNIKVTYGGLATVPSYSFVGDSDTGMYNPSSNTLCLASGGSTTFELTAPNIRALTLLTGYFGIDSKAELAVSDSNLSYINCGLGTGGTGGTAALPKIRWDNGLVPYGFYSNTNTAISVAFTNTEVVRMSGAGIQVLSGRYLGTNGSAANPTYSFTDDGDTGIYNPSTNSNEIRMATNAVDRLKINSSGIEVTGSVFTTSSYSFATDSGTSFIRNSAGNVSILCSSTTAMNLTASSVLLPTTITDTTASAGNAFLNSLTGRLQRSTSSLKYKQDVVDIEDSSFIYKLRAVSFTPKNDTKTRCDGLIAEEVALVNERYVHMADGEADGVQYDRLVAPLIAEMQKMNARILQLEAIIANNN